MPKASLWDAGMTQVVQVQRLVSTRWADARKKQKTDGFVPAREVYGGLISRSFGNILPIVLTIKETENETIH